MMLRNFHLGQAIVRVETENPLHSVARVTSLVSDFVILTIAFLNTDAALPCAQVYIPCVLLLLQFGGEAINRLGYRMQ